MLRAKIFRPRQKLFVWLVFKGVLLLRTILSFPAACERGGNLSPARTRELQLSFGKLKFHSRLLYQRTVADWGEKPSKDFILCQKTSRGPHSKEKLKCWQANKSLPWGHQADQEEGLHHPHHHSKGAEEVHPPA